MVGVVVKRAMYQRKVDVYMLNAVNSVLADVSSISPSSDRQTDRQTTRTKAGSGGEGHVFCVEFELRSFHKNRSKKNEKAKFNHVVFHLSGRDATLLIHEATFLEQHKKDCVKTQHRCSAQKRCSSTK